MDEQPPRDRKSSISGNSGTLGVKGQKPKIQPVRVTALLASCGSDYDSEDRERDSEEEDETDDCLPLPEDRVTLPADNDNDFESLQPITEATLEVSPSNVACSNELGDSGKSKLTEVKENLFCPEKPILFNKYTDDKAIKNSDSYYNKEGSKVYSAPPVLKKEKTFTNNLAALSIASESIKRSKSHSPDPKFEPSLLKEQEEYRANKSRLRQSGLLYYERGDEKIHKSSHTGLEELSIKPKKIFSSDDKPQSEPSNRGNGYLQVERNFSTEVAAAAPSAPSAPSSNANGPLYLVTDTPLKHTQPAGGTRPTPCHSHKTLFGSSQNQMTPQNKIESDFQKNFIQTPASIVPPWSESLLHTPLPSQVIYSTGKPLLTSSSSKLDLQRYFSVENKGVRRPLAETMKPNSHLIKDIPTYSLEPKPTPLQYTPGPTIEVPLRPSLVQSNPELKENRSPNDNEQLKPEIAPKHFAVPDKENLITPRMMASNLNHQVKERKVSQDVKDSVKNCATIKSRSEQPKILERVPIAPPPNIKIAQKDEFLVVKNVRYRNLGLVGRGMSGKVYRVQNLFDNELRAIKFVDLSKLDKEGVDGCLEEIRMLHKLQAPCIIKMFDYEVKETSVYVVMELGDTDLSSLIKTNSVEKDLYFTLYYWRQMLTAVDHIHKNGVIHSDLKPGNFVLVKGALKLIDFGIASSINSDMTSVVKNSTTGTLNYISPEALTDIGGSPSQSSKHKINYKSDVWSLGCILYSLVYGQTPFHEIRNQWQKISAITNPQHKIPFPNNIGAKSKVVPPVLIDVMRKCLNRDRKARPTVEQLLEVSYISVQPAPNFEIPAHIMAAIKQNRLSDEGWRKFLEFANVGKALVDVPGAVSRNSIFYRRPPGLQTLSGSSPITNDMLDAVVKRSQKYIKAVYFSPNPPEYGRVHEACNLKTIRNILMSCPNIRKLLITPTANKNVCEVPDARADDTLRKVPLLLKPHG